MQRHALSMRQFLQRQQALEKYTLQEPRVFQAGSSIRQYQQQKALKAYAPLKGVKMVDLASK